MNASFFYFIYLSEFTTLCSLIRFFSAAFFFLKQLSLTLDNNKEGKNNNSLFPSFYLSPHFCDYMTAK